MLQYESKRKQFGYYGIKNIDNKCILTLAVNPKEYLELFELNKKHKIIKKGSSGLRFENFTNRITSLVNFSPYKKAPLDSKQVSRFSVFGSEMVKVTVTKYKFSQLNDKRFYFPDRIVSLPLPHPILAEIDDFKQKRTKD